MVRVLSAQGPGQWPVNGQARTQRAAADAKAYLMHAISSFDRKATQRQMDIWFGRGVYTDQVLRSKILYAMTSVLRMIDNVHFVPHGRECQPNVYAYVYPESFSSCTALQTLSQPCTKTADGKFVFYLCSYHFKNPDEMVETLVHEGSHHAVARLDDVKFQGETAYGRDLCRVLASSNSNMALKNADNFCYYIQAVATEVRTIAGRGVVNTEDGGTPVKVPVHQKGTGPVVPEVEENYDHESIEYMPTCMRSGPTGMHVKTIKPDEKGNCECKYGSLSCYEGPKKKCTFNAEKNQVQKFAHHSKFAASCMACSCKYA